MCSNTEEQVKNYIETLHSDNLSSSLILYHKAFSYGKGYLTKRQMIKAITRTIKNERKCYATLNRYISLGVNEYGYKEYRRNVKSLMGLEVICLDLDLKTEMDINEPRRFREQEVLKYIKQKANRGDIIMPTAVSFTGSGGLHIYYAFNEVPKQMMKTVQVVKYELAEQLAEQYRELDEYMDGMEYRVDLNSMDHQRIDRVPGSIHELTGKMCTFHVIGEKFDIKELAEELNDRKLKYTYAIKNCKHRIKVYSEGRMVKPYKKMTFKKKWTSVILRTPKDLALKRMDELFVLAKSGHGFYRCRELACFLLRVFCDDAGYSYEDKIAKMEELNRLFYEPLAHTELMRTARQQRHYKFTNGKIREMLGLSETEGFFVGKRVFKNKAEQIKNDIKAIAELVKNGLKIKEIAEKLSMSLSKVKRLKLRIIDETMSSPI